MHLDKAFLTSTTTYAFKAKQEKYQYFLIEKKFLICLSNALYVFNIRHEAMTDLITILGSLVDSKGKILIPGINDSVAKLTDDEQKLYEPIDFDIVSYYRYLNYLSALVAGCIQPNYCTVCLVFSKLLGKLVVKYVSTFSKSTLKNRSGCGVYPITWLLITTIKQA